MLQRLPHGFLPNMKLEVVDKRNPRLIRVATIIEVDDQRLKVHVLYYYIIYGHSYPHVSCHAGYRGSDFLAQKNTTSFPVTYLHIERFAGDMSVIWESID